MLTTKVIDVGGRQAVYIPQEIKTTEEEFVIKRSGNCYFLIPTNDPWALLRSSIGQLDEDIVLERDQPTLFP